MPFHSHVRCRPPPLLLTTARTLASLCCAASAFNAPVSAVGSSRTSAVTMAKKDTPWSFTGFLQSPRKSFYGDKKSEGELELLSGQNRPGALATLSQRFKFDYDTRPKKPVKVASKSSKINPKDAKTW